MDISIENEYGYKEDYSYLEKVVEIALKEEKVKNPILTIVFVDEARIQKINRDYRGIDKVTDVISFAFEETQDYVCDAYRFLGEIYICIPKMEAQASEFGHSSKRELSFLTVHGILHLLGYDHMTKEEEEIMFAKQDTILSLAGILR